MKLSDAIVAGSTLIRFDPSIYLSYDDCGCLIGMGAQAIGRKRLTDGGEFVFPEYPWLFNKLGAPVELRPSLGGFPAFLVISEMARMIRDGSYTFEQALAWIRSVEPAEPSEKVDQNELLLCEEVDK